MIYYIIQTIAFQVFFLLVYDAFLKKETFFNWNRIYLLGTAVLSIILPFIKIESFKEVVPQEYIMSLPKIVLGETTSNTNTPIALNTVIINNNDMSYWEIVFYIGVTIFMLVFFYKLLRILILIFKNPKTYSGKLTLVKLINSNAAFSFFRYVFLGEFLKNEEKETILKHEMIHVKQMHSIDLLVFEALRILFWFNPLVYMYQNRITALHEFIADAEAVKYEGKSKYYQNLLAKVFETNTISFINPFFNQSLIKKRIVMLQKSKSKQVGLFKYALLIPIVIGMLVYTSSDAQEKKQNNSVLVSSEESSNDDDLIEGFQNEFNKLKADGAVYQELKEAFLPNSILFILTKEEYYKQKIFFKYLGKNYKSKNSDANNWMYSEYLEFKKTDEAKEIWESDTNEGTLKLLVKDINSFSVEETQKFDKKNELLSKDVSFTSLMVTDIEGSAIKMYYQPNEFSSANKRDDSKVITLNQVDLDVGFSVVDKVPVFPGCEELTNVEQKDCMSKNITMFVNKNYNTKVAVEHGLTGRQRINVVFKIDKEGNIVGIRSRAPHPSLEDEAIRVIKLLPKMIPGEHDGKTVNVTYSLPIIVQFKDDEKPKESELIPLDEVNVDVPFSIIEQVPVFPGCEDLATNAEKKKCMSQKISEFVSRKFNTDKANNLGLTGRQRINVIFKINKEGSITTDDVRARAPHIDLESEAIRVVTGLPRMKPGIHRGKAVSVPYSLPIVFEVKNNNQMLDEVIIDVPFSVVEEVPIFPGCDSLQNREEKMNCTSNGINVHVNRSFDIKLVKKLGLSGRQRINVIFKIDKEGRIIDVRSRASHPDLEAEAIRVINTLPIMIPGKQRGKNVRVPYSLPIIFQVAD